MNAHEALSSSVDQSVHGAVSGTVRRRLRRHSALLSLEQRFMFDGAALATAVDATNGGESVITETPDNPIAVQVAESPVGRTESRREVVFIESNVANYEALAGGVRDGVEVVILDASQDGLAQMAKWAETHSGYDAIHVISHGSEGRIDLGSLSLNIQSASTHEAELAGIGAALNQGGDLLLYGCNVAAGTGQDFIATLSTLSGADVAASTDATGAARLGGDWQLEASTGQIGVQLALGDALLASYDALLANPTITSATYDAHANVLTVTGTGLNAGDLIDTSKLTVSGEGGRTYTLTSGIVTATATGFSVVLNEADQPLVEALLNRNGTHSMVSGYWLLLDGAANWNKTQASAADTWNQITVSNMYNYCFTFETGSGVVEDTLSNDPYAGPYQSLTQTIINIYGDAGSEETLSVSYSDGMVMLGDTFEMIYGGRDYHIFDNNGLVLNSQSFNGSFTNSSSATFSLASGKEFTLLTIPVDDTYSQSGSYINLRSSDGGYLRLANKHDITYLQLHSDPQFQEISSFSVELYSSSWNSAMVVIDNLTLANVHAATASFSSGGAASTAENASGTVYQATATGGSAITYSLAGADALLFNIDASTGVVSFKNAPDYEVPQDVGADNIYDFLVIASNAEGSTSKAVALTVTDVNEAPVVTSVNSVSVAENTTGTLYTATATNPGGGAVSWSLGGADAGLFNIDPATGAVTFTHTIGSFDPVTGNPVFQTAPDYEHPSDANADNTYSIIVQATDSSTGILTGSKTVSIVVTDVNETPVITSAASASVTENSSGIVYTATGVDPDGGPLTWSLSGTDAALFNMDSSTGALSFKSNPNYESPTDGNGDNVYQVTLAATDNGGTPISVNQNLSITVTDANDAPEIFTNAELVGASEDTPFTIAYADLIVAVNDEDGDALSYLIDSVSSGTLTKNGVPVLAGVTLLGPGESLVWTPAANANGTLLAFTVRAYDGNLASATAVDVRVQVAAVNDAPTDLVLSSSNVPEHASTATPVNVGTLTSTDPDGGNTFTYSIVGGADQGVFQISGSILQIKAGTALDYETQSSYSVTVRSTDNGGLSYDKTLTVQLIDQNDAPAIGRNTGLAVTESGSAPLSSAQLQITDVDTLEASLSLTLTDIPDHGILFKSGVALAVGDSFTQADIDAGRISYTHDGSETTADGFSFSVSDGAGGTITSSPFAITVTAVNEAPSVVVPPFGLGSANTYQIGNGVYTVATADVNNDGKLDIITSGYGSGASNPNAFSVLLGNGDGTFTPYSSFGGSNNTGQVTMADLNNDGNLDIIATQNSSNVVVYLGAGDGSFTLGGEIPIGGAVRDLVATDVNGDGKVDLVLADGDNSRVVILSGLGNGTFAPLYSFSSGTNPYGVLAVDLNGDGHVDLVTANFNDSTISVLIGAGDGSFAARSDFAVGAAPLDVTVADFNRDGILDLATCNRDANSVSILMGDGNGEFGSRGDYSVGYAPAYLAAADLNGDGYLDLLVTHGAVNQYSLLTGREDGTFDSAAFGSLSGGPRSVQLADMNGDGRTDIVFAQFFSQSASIILNTSQFASFTEQQGPVRVNTGIAIHDPDGDAGWNGSQLSVQITSHAAVSDQLGLPVSNPGGNGIWIDANGNKLMAGSVQIGIASATSVNGATAWTFTFNANATNALVQNVARAVTFDNGSDNPGSASRSVTFTVTDAGGLSASGSTLVAVRTVNDAPRVETNAGLTVLSGKTAVIGSGQFGVSDPDSPASSLVYVLSGIPSHGLLSKAGVPLSVGDNFTQADVDASRITYTHDGSRNLADQISFDVRDGAGGAFNGAEFNITIRDDVPPPNHAATTVFPVTPSPAPDQGSSIPLPASTRVDFLSPNSNVLPGLQLSAEIAGHVISSRVTGGGMPSLPMLSDAAIHDMEIRMEVRGNGPIASDGLLVKHGMPDQIVETSGVTEIPIPLDVFTHTNRDALIQLTAIQSNGRPLPGWVELDKVRNKFIVRPPQGVVGELIIRLTARDASGREVSTEFSLRVGAAGEPREASGRAGLSEQIRQAARLASATDRAQSWSRVITGMRA